MLPYWPQFCNIFPASSPPAWQRAWAAWCPLSPASRARSRRLLQTAYRTPRRLSTPLLYVTRTPPPTPHTAARPWWTPRSVSLRDDHPCPRRQPPPALARAAACLSPPACFTVLVREDKAAGAPERGGRGRTPGLRGAVPGRGRAGSGAPPARARAMHNVSPRCAAACDGLASHADTPWVHNGRAVAITRRVWEEVGDHTSGANAGVRAPEGTWEKAAGRTPGSERLRYAGAGRNQRTCHAAWCQKTPTRGQPGERQRRVITRFASLSLQRGVSQR